MASLYWEDWGKASQDLYSPVIQQGVCSPAAGSDLGRCRLRYF